MMSMMKPNQSESSGIRLSIKIRMKIILMRTHVSNFRTMMSLIFIQYSPKFHPLSLILIIEYLWKKKISSELIVYWRNQSKPKQVRRRKKPQPINSPREKRPTNDPLLVNNHSLFIVSIISLYCLLGVRKRRRTQDINEIADGSGGNIESLSTTNKPGAYCSISDRTWSISNLLVTKRNKVLKARLFKVQSNRLLKKNEYITEYEVDPFFESK